MQSSMLKSYQVLKDKCDKSNSVLVLPERMEPNQLCIVGESLGEQERISGRYFDGKAGHLTDKLIAESGLIRDGIHITNLIKVQPPNNKVERLSELGLSIADFIPYLKEELEHVKPRTILALGRYAMEVLTGKEQVTKWRGSVVDGILIPGTQVLITLHPSYLQRGNMFLYPYVRADFKQYGELVFNLRKDSVPYEQVIDPTLTETLDFLHDIYTNSSETCFDIETVGASHITCIGYSSNPNRGICIPFRHGGLKNRWEKHEQLMILDMMRQVYHKSGLVKIGQYMHYDMHFLLPILGFPREPLFDTMHAHSLIHADARHDLGFLVSAYTDMPYHKDEAKDWESNKLPHDKTLWEYNIKDIIGTHRVYTALKKDLIELNMYDFFTGYLMPFRRVLFQMEHEGLRIDVDEMKDWAKFIEEEELPIALKILHRMTKQEINPNSSKQIGEYLTSMGVNVPRTALGNFTVDEDKLNELRARHPEHRQLFDQIICTRVLKAKDLGTYLTATLSSDNRMRTSYSTTVTGRLNSKANHKKEGTNLQNQPKKFRKIFLPDEGDVFLEPDLSQAEARVMAWLMKSATLKAIFNSGKKIHKIMGGAIYEKDPDRLTEEEYHIAKVTVHGSNYKMGLYKYATTIGKPVAIARVIRNKYMQIVPQLEEYHKTIQDIITNTRRLTTPYGRSRVFTGRLDDETFRSGYAQIPQPTVEDTINIGILGLWLIKPPEIKFRTQTHDSVLISLPVSLVEWFKPYVKAHLETLRELEIEGDLLVIPVDIGEVKENWYGK